MNDTGKKEFLPALLRYVDEHNRLEAECYQTSAWRPLRRLRNLRKREAMTRVFLAKLRKYDIQR